MVSRMTCVVDYDLHVTYRENLGFGLSIQIFRVFRGRILRVRNCMGLLESFRVWGLFLGFYEFFIALFRLERECSA